MTLTIGEQAPDFSLQTDTGDIFTLSKHRGQPLVLYFYPKDNTPGCTKQACDFRDHHAAFKKKGIQIFGISKDSPVSHTKFKQKYALPFTLLVDADAEVCLAYGVMKKKSLFGKSFLGIQRSTFYIDEQGIIQGMWRGVKVPGHVEKILNEIQ